MSRLTETDRASWLRISSLNILVSDHVFRWFQLVVDSIDLAALSTVPIDLRCRESDQRRRQHVRDGDGWKDGGLPVNLWQLFRRVNAELGPCSHADV